MERREGEGEGEREREGEGRGRGRMFQRFLRGGECACWMTGVQRKIKTKRTSAARAVSRPVRVQR